MYSDSDHASLHSLHLPELTESVTEINQMFLGVPKQRIIFFNKKYMLKTNVLQTGKTCFYTLYTNISI